MEMESDTVDVGESASTATDVDRSFSTTTNSTFSLLFSLYPGGPSAVVAYRRTGVRRIVQISRRQRGTTKVPPDHKYIGLVIRCVSEDEGYCTSIQSMIAATYMNHRLPLLLLNFCIRFFTFLPPKEEEESVFFFLFITFHLGRNRIRIGSLIQDANMFAPYADMLNHSCKPNCFSHWRFRDRMFEVMTNVGQRIKKGEEMTVNYMSGQRNTSLMQRYGLSSPDNPWDVLPFSVLD
ncbi:unnamed protein product [Lactuca virosa]|uniref:SET domain-containing protein n=1 Tax=Lactuca virosa TaxID=75947 RepID=A0AAU9NEV1_9ASTR|nr:unnamed protein product [Lactuca virosa]